MPVVCLMCVILENETEKEQSPPSVSIYEFINLHIQYKILKKNQTQNYCMYTCYIQHVSNYNRCIVIKMSA